METNYDLNFPHRDYSATIRLTMSKRELACLADYLKSHTPEPGLKKLVVDLLIKECKTCLHEINVYEAEEILLKESNPACPKLT